jgi:hypothetical protein
MIVYFDMGFYIYWHISGIGFTWNAPWVIHTFNIKGMGPETGKRGGADIKWKWMAVGLNFS